MIGARDGIGLIGCGRFARFLLESLGTIAEVRLAALASRRQENLAEAAAAWRRFRSGPASVPRFYTRWEELLADPDVALVLVATPPDMHYRIGRAALLAGKPVLLEKPGGLFPEEPEELDTLAAARGLAAGVNLVMRHSPIYRWLREIVAARSMGALERVMVENEAHGDLPPGHWFWDPARSGGILVEHGVHFLDLMHWLIGPAGSAAAIAMPNARGEELAAERVSATVVHGGGVLVSYYHAFTRPAGMGRTWLEFVFDRGYVRVFGWTPTALEVDALVAPGMGSRFPTALPGARIAIHAEEPLPERSFLARGRPFTAEKRVRMRLELACGEEEAYRMAIRASFQDLQRAARDRAHRPAATLRDAAAALRLARRLDGFLVPASAPAREPFTAPGPSVPRRDGISP